MDKQVRCFQCGNTDQFDEVVVGACYTNRYYLDKEGNTVVETRQKSFEADNITFICSSCGADIDDMDAGGGMNMRDVLMEKYSEYKKEKVGV